ncbi:MAG: hypothetical protein ABJA98_02500 [Acidobacteriota bacterium]
MDLLRAVEASHFSEWVRESGSIWSYPTIIFLHSVGLAIIVGLSTAIDLRVLGFAPDLPVAPMEKLFPIMWAGFWVNAVSGVFLAAADAPAMMTSWLFLLKMAIIGFALVTMVSLRRELFRPPTSGRVMSGTAKALAVTSLLLWTGAITAGRLTAYLGPSAEIKGVH